MNTPCSLVDAVNLGPTRADQLIMQVLYLTIKRFVREMGSWAPA